MGCSGHAEEAMRPRGLSLIGLSAIVVGDFLLDFHRIGHLVATLGAVTTTTMESK
jgi:hypothetical protein